jgi:glycosyltransferase involved in cell wall biosynthesis
MNSFKANINSSDIKLTIGMPVFNDIAFIEKSLNSILNLNDVKFLLLISDDGSTDGSGEICKKYVAKDDRIQYVRQPVNLGISKNMEFLLEQAKTPYFMWAADDDLWHPDFARKLIKLLQEDSTAVSAFCSYKAFDDYGNHYNVISKNYKNADKIKRLKNFIRDANDSFGYGIFKTEAIREVKFPIWWWPNKKTPYNNIYPTLCFYLAQGDFAFYDKEVLFFKREKPEKYTNHILVGKGNGIKETFAFIIRRFNLITYSTKLIRKSSGPLVALNLYFTLLFQWFFKSTAEQLMLIYSSMKNRLFAKQ